MVRAAVYIFAVTLGVSVYFGVANSYVEKGVRKEQVRVATEGAKLEKRIEKAQRAVQRKPASSVLDKWSVP